MQGRQKIKQPYIEKMIIWLPQRWHGMQQHPKLEYQSVNQQH